MLSNNSFTTAIPSAAALGITGQIAVAKPGTLIGELVRLSVPIEMKDFNGKDVQTTNDSKAPVADWHSVASFGDQVNYVTKGTIDNPSLHSLEQDGYVADLAKVVTQHVAHAKNNVRPLVSSFALELQNYLTTTKPKDAATLFNIRTLRMSTLLKDESFLDTLVAFKDSVILTPEVSLNLGSKTKEELAELVLVGHDRTNKLIVEWLSHKSDEFLPQVWGSFFSVKSEGSTAALLYYEDLNRMNAFDKADCALAMVLISRKITDQVQESTMALAGYKNICAQYVKYASSLLVDALAKLNTAIRTKQLVIEKSPTTFDIAVNGELYPQWLEEGGTPEVLMGLLISNGSASSQALINESRDAYLRQWNSYSAFFKTKEVNASFSYAKSFIETLFAQSLQTVDEIEAEFILKTPNFAEIVVTSARNVLLNMKASDLEDPYAVALLFVAKVRFYYTSAYQILSDIEAVSRINPNVDVREAALLAVINYVSDFVADQIVLTNQ